MEGEVVDGERDEGEDWYGKGEWEGGESCTTSERASTGEFGIEWPVVDESMLYSEPLGPTPLQAQPITAPRPATSLPPPSMPTIPQVKSVKPKRHHGYNFFLFLLGTLFPPLGMSLFNPSSHLINRSPAVAARFGIGGDFWLNLVLTLCGYIPGLSVILLIIPS